MSNASAYGLSSSTRRDNVLVAAAYVNIYLSPGLSFYAFLSMSGFAKQKAHKTFGFLSRPSLLGLWISIILTLVGRGSGITCKAGGTAKTTRPDYISRAG
jgi:hypothetical protein